MLGSLESFNYGIQISLCINNAFTSLDASEDIVKESEAAESQIFSSMLTSKSMQMSRKQLIGSLENGPIILSSTVVQPELGLG
ncbi:unnamed protein product [Cylicocyclus nassatus]|uniref:Uncharacterized protein n=1 Tax=Cylicocyclus nassatus TaxID=53992 RepID=A0AA36GMB6_CYLNA|nr:unnamed protein product [Cylicocyclus nassatus]